jgi:hypothetical protein
MVGRTEGEVIRDVHGVWVGNIRDDKLYDTSGIYLGEFRFDGHFFDSNGNRQGQLQGKHFYDIYNVWKYTVE